jgi:hypothetical protein
MKTIIFLCALFCVSCSYVAVLPTRVKIDSVDKEPVYWPGIGYPNEMITDTLNTYYTKLRVKRKMKYMKFLERPGLKEAWDSATIVQKKKKIYIIK